MKIDLRNLDTEYQIDTLLRVFDDLEDRHNGCCLHIAIVDYNLTDSSLDFCRTVAEKAGHTTCAQAAKLFAALIPEEKREAFLGVRCDDDGHVHHVTPWRP